MDLNVTDGGYQYSTNINDLPDEIFLLMMENMNPETWASFTMATKRNYNLMSTTRTKLKKKKCKEYLAREDFDARNHCLSKKPIDILCRIDECKEIIFGPDQLEVINDGNGNFRIPKGVTRIATAAFDNKPIKSIVLPNTLSEIGEYAFVRAKKLKSISIPDSVKFIGMSAFTDCAGLESVKLPTGLKRIEESTFSGCTSLKTVQLPDDLEEISEYAFEDCSSLEDIKLPAGLKRISSYTFSGCTSLKSIQLPAGLEQIGWSAFLDCYSLESLEFLGSVDYINKYAFRSCHNIKTVTFHNTLEDFENIIDFLTTTDIRTMRFNKQLISSKKELLDYFGNIYSLGRNPRRRTLLEKVDIEFF
tara:strand:+ start:1165 stop:2247 length:1083 start_codon:yes stop_codon:yes gene_type:complete